MIDSIGTYWVSYKNGSGCKEVDTFFVSLIVAPIINNLKDTLTCNNLLPFNVNAVYPNTIKYVWFDSSMSVTHSFTNAGIYWIDYYLNNNCFARDSFNLAVRQVLSPDSFPNIVTPNNDGINDFIDFNKYKFSSLQLEIYNRWGIKIFESTNPDCVWKPNCDADTYFMIVYYTVNCSNKNEILSIKNFVTIIK